MSIKSPDYYLARLQKMARARGGLLLSRDYLGDATKLRFRCGEGHVWLVTPSQIKQGRWCPVCWIAGAAEKNRAHGLARLRRVVARHRGTIVSGPYLGAKTVLRFRCREGHAWRTAPAHVLQGRWCPACADKRREEYYAKRRGRTSRRLLGIVERRGGEILPPGYRNFQSALLVRCSRGHVWSAWPRSIDEGAWCQACRQDDLLAELRALAERRGGECLSRSCHSGYERLAWRCVQGHRFVTTGNQVKAGKWCGKCHGSPPGDIERMRRMASERGGECLSKKYVGCSVKLRWRCREGHEWNAIPGSIIQGTWCRVCQTRGGHSLARLSIEIMRRMAAERSGACLSATYFGSRVPLRWRCARGHTWMASPGRMRSGRWCPVCSHAVRGTLDGMRELAMLHGGRCLTKVWNNHRKALAFECARGHGFRASASVVKTGVWCPTCRASALRRRSDLV